MLARYTMRRGKRQNGEPLPQGIRQDTRHRTRHLLRPTREMVEAYLASPTEQSWTIFRKAYLASLEERFQCNRQQFDQLTMLAMENDVFLGCNCPTKKNPDVYKCHTLLALRFMKEKSPGLDVVYPMRTAPSS